MSSEGRAKPDANTAINNGSRSYDVDSTARKLAQMATAIIWPTSRVHVAYRYACSGGSRRSSFTKLETVESEPAPPLLSAPSTIRVLADAPTDDEVESAAQPVARKQAVALHRSVHAGKVGWR